MENELNEALDRISADLDKALVIAKRTNVVMEECYELAKRRMV